jgi:glycosyltransferase involved in cell wall biosynthesis
VVNKIPHILLLEPYYGGSHKNFLTGLVQHVSCDFTLLTLPARKWKMRMQLAAPWFAERIEELAAAGTRFDSILCSTFIDVAVLRCLLAKKRIYLPLGIYFHENQFSYPGQVPDSGMFQFCAINFTSALCADLLAFNSQYNLETFLQGVRGYLKKATDMKLSSCVEMLSAKATVLYPGMDYTFIDNSPAQQKNKDPIVLWNHRWEHDKDPETFFEGLFALQKKFSFKLIVLGEQFRQQPSVFAKAKQRLEGRLIHFGYVPDKGEYARLLKLADIIVSTAVHEFFGISVLEGVRAGCIPLVPDRLSYQELFPLQYRYPANTFTKYLGRLLHTKSTLDSGQSLQLTEPYSWTRLASHYTRWLNTLESNGTK